MFFIVAANVVILVVGFVSVRLMRSVPRDEARRATRPRDIEPSPVLAGASEPPTGLRAAGEGHRVVLSRSYIDGEELDSLFAFDSHLAEDSPTLRESAKRES